MQINYENALRFLDTYFDTYDNHIGRQCWQLIRNKAEAQPQADNSNCMKVLCGCGDVIELNGTRDYKYEGGKYYCVDCMRS